MFGATTVLKSINPFFTILGLMPLYDFKNQLLSRVILYRLYSTTLIIILSTIAIIAEYLRLPFITRYDQNNPLMFILLEISQTGLGFTNIVYMILRSCLKGPQWAKLFQMLHTLDINLELDVQRKLPCKPMAKLMIKQLATHLCSFVTVYMWSGMDPPCFLLFRAINLFYNGILTVLLADIALIFHNILKAIGGRLRSGNVREVRNLLLHLQLCMDVVDDLFGLSIGLVFAFYWARALMVFLIGYNVIMTRRYFTMALAPVQIESLVLQGLFLVFPWVAASVCHGVTMECDKLSRTCQRLLDGNVDMEVRIELQDCMQQISMKKLNFSLSGIRVDRKLILMHAGAIGSYLVVIVQFFK